MNPPIRSHHVYRSGECWKYEAPPGQEGSRLVVLGSEFYETIGWVIHISVEGLRIPAPKVPGGFVTELMHLPMSLVSFEKSLVAEDRAAFRPVEFPNAGYETWRDNRGGAWDVTVGDVVKMMVGFYSERD